MEKARNQKVIMQIQFLLRELPEFLENFMTAIVDSACDLNFLYYEDHAIFFCVMKSTPCLCHEDHAMSLPALLPPQSTPPSLLSVCFGLELLCQNFAIEVEIKRSH